MNRALIQYLESLRRAGINGLPSHAEPFELPEIEASTETEPTPVAPSRPRQNSAQESTSTPVAPSATTVSATGERTPPNQERSTVSLEEREAALQVMSEQVAACTRCPELCSTRQQTVFGVGKAAADIMFIGEAPGADEDRLGIPFVGKAGQLLDKIITACQLTREEIYICNILRCRPPGNRNPKVEEADHCREWLDGQIATVDPDYIVCWGTVAAQNLLGVTTSIGRMRGKVFRYGRAHVFCTYHPSYLLRNPNAKKNVWDDMKVFRQHMGVDLSS